MTKPETTENPSKPIDIDTPVWGGRAIAAVINKPLMATFHMLEQGKLSSARKKNGRWVGIPRELIRDLFGEPRT